MAVKQVDRSDTLTLIVEAGLDEKGNQKYARCPINEMNPTISDSIFYAVGSAFANLSDRTEDGIERKSVYRIEEEA